jgi:acyl carrier protein
MESDYTMEQEKAIQIVQEAILKHEFIPATDYTLESTIEELGISSLDLVEIGMMIEDVLKEDISNDKLDNIHTVGDLVKIVESYE